MVKEAVWFFYPGEILEVSLTVTVEEMNCALSQERCVVSMLSSWLQYFIFSFKEWV